MKKKTESSHTKKKKKKTKSEKLDAAYKNIVNWKNSTQNERYVHSLCNAVLEEKQIWSHSDCFRT